jgi:3-hydroxy-3-methylglutaryl CoA synthase
MGGIVSYGSYLPYWRIDRAAIGQFLGEPQLRGTRSVASYDEDATSMGVEAARNALRSAAGIVPETLTFATTAPPYLDKNNASALHAALRLPAETFAVDALGSVRSGVAALRAAAPAPALAVVSDLRTGLAGSEAERAGGDGAAAFLFGDGPDVLAEPAGGASVTAEFLDRWRLPGETHSRVWEERFGEAAYAPLAEQAITEACKSAGVTTGDIDRLLVTGQSSRAVRRAARAAGVAAEVTADEITGVVGNTGAAHPGLLLASALDDARAGQLIALVVLADGADVLLWRTTPAIERFQPAVSVADQIRSGRDGLDYARFLTWRGMLTREPPRRPDPERPAAPPSARNEEWKFAFVASRCTSCGERHLPPQRVCHHCHAVDEMAPEPLADVGATLVTYSVDHLVYSPSPPMILAVLDFDGGGRLRCELTDADPDTLAVGDRLEMTFRRLFTAVGGVHNYFWKARPVREAHR